jgi:hypothetical protein
MNIGDLLGKVKNFAGNVKGKQGEIKSFLDNLKGSKSSEMPEPILRGTIAPIEPEFDPKDEKPPYLMYGAIILVVLFVVFGKKMKF